MSRVLVVEDDDDIREFVALALADEGHDVRTAPNGRVALELLDVWTPDLILLDMRMPILDGWAFARALRELPGPLPRLVVMTAARDAEASASEVDADAWLAKPFELGELFAQVEGAR